MGCAWANGAATACAAALVENTRSPCRASSSGQDRASRGVPWQEGPGEEGIRNHDRPRPDEQENDPGPEHLRPLSLRGRLEAARAEAPAPRAESTEQDHVPARHRWAK